jgi:hypothetical protein
MYRGHYDSEILLKMFNYQYINNLQQLEAYSCFLSGQIEIFSHQLLQNINNAFPPKNENGNGIKEEVKQHSSKTLNEECDISTIYENKLSTSNNYKESQREKIDKFHKDDIQEKQDISEEKNNHSSTNFSIHNNNEKSISKNKILKFKVVSNFKSLNFSSIPKRHLGKMSLTSRLRKILRFKVKLNIHRTKIPVIRKFNGRSKIAQNKNRVRGRFVKKIKKFFSIKVVHC